MTVLRKQFTRRNMPLFFSQVWQVGEQNDLQDLIGERVDDLLFVYDAELDKTRVWYGRDEYDGTKLVDAVESKIAEDSGWLEVFEKKYYEIWDEILPYLREASIVNSLAQFKRYFYLWRMWSAFSEVVWVINDSSVVDKKARVMAAKIREESQAFSDGGYDVFKEWLIGENGALEGLWQVMSYEELLLAIEGRLGDKELTVIRKRLNGYCLLNGDIFLLTEFDRKLEERGLTIEKEISEKVDEIKGVGSSHGKIQGSVRLVLSDKDLELVEEGEIIVTEMTSPDFMPALKHVSAIVTDEGGLLSHAMIVSRELGIPCVVGTKISTQILQNGDLVEADFSTGLVKIL